MCQGGKFRQSKHLGQSGQIQEAKPEEARLSLFVALAFSPAHGVSNARLAAAVEGSQAHLHSLFHCWEDWLVAAAALLFFFSFSRPILAVFVLVPRVPPQIISACFHFPPPRRRIHPHSHSHVSSTSTSRVLSSVLHFASSFRSPNILFCLIFCFFFVLSVSYLVSQSCLLEFVLVASVHGGLDRRSLGLLMLDFRG